MAFHHPLPDDPAVGGATARPSGSSGNHRPVVPSSERLVTWRGISILRRRQSSPVRSIRRHAVGTDSNNRFSWLELRGTTWASSSVTDRAAASARSSAPGSRLAAVSRHRPRGRASRGHHHRGATRFVLAVVVAALPVLSSCQRQGATGPVVIYLVDTLRADHVSAYGGRHEVTPAAEAFASDAVVYDSAFAVSTWTRPSVATLLTSLLPGDNGAVGRFGRLSPTVPYLPELFRAAGWRTISVGSNGNIVDPRLGFGRGFDEFRSLYSASNRFRAVAREIVDDALAVIVAQSSPKFFLYVHVVDPHAPYKLEPAYAGMFRPPTGEPSLFRDRQLLDYDRCIRQADDQFGRLVEGLKRRGWWRNATVVYVSDHGEEFEEHGGWGHGFTIFEEQVRVPLIVKYPGGRWAGTRWHDPVTLADLTPTLAELCGLQGSARWIGRSLLDRRPDPGRTVYFTEDLDHVRTYGLQRGRGKVIASLYPSLGQTVFDLVDDPKETAGTKVACGATATGRTSQLVTELAQLRNWELLTFPGIWLKKEAAEPLTFHVELQLGADAKPFLSSEDACRWAAAIKDGTLAIRADLWAGEPFGLFLADDDMGLEPSLDWLPATDSAGATGRTGEPPPGLRLVRKPAWVINGPTTDEVQRANLRSLGYMQ
jgi:hypothetical protein